MSKKDTLNNRLAESQTDWERLEAMTDEEIDFSDIPELTAEQLAMMRPTGELIPPLENTGKQRITIRLDKDIVRFFKRQARAEDASYQTLINSVLREHVIYDSARANLRALVREIVREELAKGG